MSRLKMQYRFLFLAWAGRKWINENLFSYDANPMAVDSNSATISGLTQGLQGIGTKIILRWGDDRTSYVNLTDIEVTYKKKSKLTPN